MYDLAVTMKPDSLSLRGLRHCLTKPNSMVELLTPALAVGASIQIVTSTLTFPERRHASRNSRMRSSVGCITATLFMRTNGLRTSGRLTVTVARRRARAPSSASVGTAPFATTRRMRASVDGNTKCLSSIDSNELNSIENDSLGALSRNTSIPDPATATTSAADALTAAPAVGGGFCCCCCSCEELLPFPSACSLGGGGGTTSGSGALHCFVHLATASSHGGMETVSLRVALPSDLHP
mmetsp:Transcript_406/g.798  ORF Transcript_406/g.798 Transcript_406/m.798 type:complete len:238 (-) Transcript_406:915-1628(-)